MNNKPPKWIDKLKYAVEQSECYFDVLRRLGLFTNSGNQQTVQKYVRILKLDTSHFDAKKAMMRGIRRHSISSRIPEDKIFIEYSEVSKTAVKRAFRLRSEYKCKECGNEGIHNNRKLVLQLDHINGINTDNRLENLRWVCPNCHSQTDTFGNKRGKVKKKRKERNAFSNRVVKQRPRKVEWPSKEELKNLMDTTTWVDIGKKYSVTDNAVRKWAKHYKLI